MTNDGLVEGSIYNQIKAIEGWALLAYQESVKNTPNVELILDNLRKINLQARKLEWRGKGLETLPKGQVAEDLKKKVTQLRAAVVTLRDIKKDTELSNASKRTLRVLSTVGTEARKLVEQFAKGLPDLSKFNKNNFEDFFRGEDEYATYALDVRRKLWNEYQSSKAAGTNYHAYENLNLSNADLRGFDFSKRSLYGIDFSGANLAGVSFFGSRLGNINFSRANLEGANFGNSSINSSPDYIGKKKTGVNFTGVKAHKVSFKEAWIYSNDGGPVILSGGDFTEADFSNFRGFNTTYLFLEISGADFSGANFKYAKMYFDQPNKPPLFKNANMKEAEFFVQGPQAKSFLDRQLKAAKNYSSEQVKVKG